MTFENKSSYGAVPVAEAVQIVEVTAPANMQEGVNFDAVHNGILFAVIVPAGGVQEGDIIQVPFDPTNTGTATSVIGRWKDDLFACTRHGICHPSFLNACCCQLVLLGQVMTRLKMNWKAQPAPPEEVKNTFRNMVIVTVVMVITMVMTTPQFDIDIDDEFGNLTIVQEDPSVTYHFLQFTYFVYALYVVMKVRKAVRERDSIPAGKCGNLEDVCCAYFCGCCTVSQMSRQTANYDDEQAAFFTSDGLTVTAQTPVMVV